ncbi:hypothetical protein [Roseospira navarrensis]|uniref:Uncharacterized protein n=1 Tax=Roseospira navarrensis TaxID=140058 RepID=A0A7X1ZEV8_9PROT|nr:hypothetical protein [Roseospira navarrensis]MQX35955.1 hypothetical protein [Roseospira navarrensis]
MKLDPGSKAVLQYILDTTEAPTRSQAIRDALVFFGRCLWARQQTR